MPNWVYNGLEIFRATDKTNNNPPKCVLLKSSSAQKNGPIRNGTAKKAILNFYDLIKADSTFFSLCAFVYANIKANDTGNLARIE